MLSYQFAADDAPVGAADDIWSTFYITTSIRAPKHAHIENKLFI